MCIYVYKHTHPHTHTPTHTHTRIIKSLYYIPETNTIL